MLIQTILLGFLVALFLIIIRQRAVSSVIRAACVACLLLASYVVAFPKVTNRVAIFAGVGRGVDFVIYLSIASIAVLLATLYIRAKNHELSTARLVQLLAIQNYRLEQIERRNSH